MPDKKPIIRSASHWLLVILMLASLALHFVVAGFEHPTHFTQGTSIEKPANLEPFDESSNSFRVATYNIQRSKGTDGKRDLTRTTSVFNKPDIVALQEVAGTLFYGRHNQAQQIAEQLGLGWLYAPSMTRWYQPYKGNALLSRFNVKSWSIEPLPRQARSQKLRFRNLITAVVEIKGKDVTIMATHIARRDDAQRAYVLEKFNQVQGPVILLGDLNAHFEHPQIQSLFEEAANVDTIELAIGEFWRLDWIVTRGLIFIEGGYTPRGISDHAHYWVELAFEQQTPEPN